MRSQSITVGLSVAIAAMVLAPGGTSSPGAQEPTFRTGIQSVRVDVYATLNGQPVSDLRREDVQLLEDGTQQTIQTFERITFAPPTSIAPAEPRTLEESRRRASDPHSRLFVLFLPTPDEGFALGPIAEARRLLVQPLNDLLGADDLIAVMTPYTRLGDLTFRRRVPVNDSRFLSNADIADPKHRLWDVCYPPQTPGSPNAEMKARHLELITFEALEALVGHLGGFREERKHILLVGDGFRLYTENPALAARGGQAPLGFPAGRGPEGLGTIPRRENMTSLSRDVLQECDADLTALASLNHRNRLEQLGALASRNNVSFTPVSLARMRTQNSGSRARSRPSAENATSLEMEAAMRGLAENTDGVPVIDTNDIQQLLRQMMNATSVYYLLGYTSTNSALDGKFRRITVRVDRPGVRVHARSGYVATNPPADSRAEPRAGPKPTNAVMEAIGTVVAATANRQLHVRTSTWMRTDSDGRSVGTIWIVGEVDARSQKTRGLSAVRAAQIVLQPPSGSGVSKRLDLPDGVSAFDFVIDERLGAGDYSVRVSVTRQDDEPLREIVRIRMPDEPSSLSEPIVSRREPNAAQRYVRTADLRFQRNERLRVEVATNSMAPPSAMLRDSAGAVLPVPLTIGERTDGSSSWRWITADVPLVALAPAIYAIEVRQGSASRIAAFQVLR